MKSKKMIIATMVFGMAVTGSAGVYAGTNLEKISAYLNHGIGFKVNGAAYTPVDNNGKTLAPITYHDTTYLPVRALADVLKVPVTFNPATNQVILGTSSGSTTPGSGSITLATIQYSAAQKEAITKAFANFQGFETAYAPVQMISGDAFVKVVGGEDGVSFLFNHMNVNVSPRDSSYIYTGETVKLSNGTEAKWYSPSTGTTMLTFKLADRFVTISSPDKALSKAQLEKVAVSVAKLSNGSDSAITVAAVQYSAAQKEAITKAFATFQGFETAYAPAQMISGDAFLKVAGGEDGVSFLFNHMNVNVSPRDYSYSYDGDTVKLSNGTEAKWYSPSGDTAMLTFKLADRFVTISSPDKALSKAQLEKVAVSVAKLSN